MPTTITIHKKTVYTLLLVGMLAGWLVIASLHSHLVAGGNRAGRAVQRHRAPPHQMHHHVNYVHKDAEKCNEEEVACPHFFPIVFIQVHIGIVFGATIPCGRARITIQQPQQVHIPWIYVCMYRHTLLGKSQSISALLLIAVQQPKIRSRLMSTHISICFILWTSDLH